MSLESINLVLNIIRPITQMCWIVLNRLMHPGERHIQIQMRKLSSCHGMIRRIEGYVILDVLTLTMVLGSQIINCFTQTLSLAA